MDYFDKKDVRENLEETTENSFKTPMDYDHVEYYDEDYDSYTVPSPMRYY